MLAITALRSINKAQYQFLLLFLIMRFSDFFLCKYSLLHSKHLFFFATLPVESITYAISNNADMFIRIQEKSNKLEWYK